jgi:NAD dependent epimerase/dehydratase family
MERALITGVAGFIGSHAASELLRLGWLVTGVDTRSPASDPVAAENLSELASDPQFRFARCDIAADGLTILCEDIRTVFHLAAIPGVRRSWGDRFSDYLTCKVLGTQRLLEACAAAEVPRLVFASSSSVYGAGSGKPSRETDPALPLSPYGVSKLAAERLCLAYANRRDAATTVVRTRGRETIPLVRLGIQRGIHRRVSVFPGGRRDCNAPAARGSGFCPRLDPDRLRSRTDLEAAPVLAGAPGRSARRGASPSRVWVSDPPADAVTRMSSPKSLRGRGRSI